jgi:hypothetical protein
LQKYPHRSDRSERSERGQSTTQAFTFVEVENGDQCSCVMEVGESVDVVQFPSIRMVPVTQQSKERGSQIRHQCHSPKADVAVITHYATEDRQKTSVEAIDISTPGPAEHGYE